MRHPAYKECHLYIGSARSEQYCNVNTIILRYCNSRDAIDTVHVEVAVNHVVYCSVVTQLRGQQLVAKSPEISELCVVQLPLVAILMHVESILFRTSAYPSTHLWSYSTFIIIIIIIPISLYKVAMTSPMQYEDTLDRVLTCLTCLTMPRHCNRNVAFT